MQESSVRDELLIVGRLDELSAFFEDDIFAGSDEVGHSGVGLDLKECIAVRKQGLNILAFSLGIVSHIRNYLRGFIR